MPHIATAKILIMATNRFEESELFGPRERLLELGATVRLAALDHEPIMATVIDEPGRTIAPDLTITEARADDYDALLLPGGVGNPDRLRSEPAAVALIKAFADAGKPVAAICHGPWLLVEADVVRGRTVTSWPSLKTDLKNAGAQWVDREVVVDNGLVTSRKPEDIPAFNPKVIEEFAKGQHAVAAGEFTQPSPNV